MQLINVPVMYLCHIQLVLYVLSSTYLPYKQFYDAPLLRDVSDQSESCTAQHLYKVDVSVSHSNFMLCAVVNCYLTTCVHMYTYVEDFLK